MKNKNQFKDLESSFDKALQSCNQWNSIQWLMKTFAESGDIKLWVVGGTIRDYILETANMIIDVDVILQGCPDFDVLEKVISSGGTFSRNMMGGYKWYPSKEISKDDEEIEIDLWRMEEAIEPGDECTPEVAVMRFDLNINSLAWSLDEKYFVNPLGALEILLDESHKTPMELLTEKIKPGNAGRLILRAVKYNAKLGIPLGELTKKWMLRNEKELDSLSNEKIKYVFRSIDTVSIKKEVEDCCTSILSKDYGDRIVKALFSE